MAASCCPATRTRFTTLARAAPAVQRRSVRRALDDELERARLSRVFGQGLASPVGYALPIRRDLSPDGSARWASSRWYLRGERLYLVPGDSPMGYRLPLGFAAVDGCGRPGAAGRTRSLCAAGTAAAARRHSRRVRAACRRWRLAEGGAVAAASGVRVARREHWCAVGRQESRAGGVRERATALRVGGHHHPDDALCGGARPTPGQRSGGRRRSRREQAALRVHAAAAGASRTICSCSRQSEATAAELKVRIVLEGYPPPRDPRLKLLQITPDPGVIEVNIHPASSWEQLADHTETLYEAARLSRLSTEKFMLDGRHTGTGGGNHIVLGGATADDSPFLRRPDLLGSLIAYWHNHPSLSYLFSGLFIGPTSQAPRVDEATQRPGLRTGDRAR